MEWGFPKEFAGTVELLVSEIVTNAILASQDLTESWFGGEHLPGRPPVRLWLESHGPWVVIHLWDGNEAIPRLQDPAFAEEHGRGMFLVTTLSERYWVDRLEGATGKVVHVRVAAVPEARS